MGRKRDEGGKGTVGRRQRSRGEKTGEQEGREAPRQRRKTSRRRKSRKGGKDRERGCAEEEEAVELSVFAACTSTSGKPTAQPRCLMP